jgi:signal transduction histidine kinase
MFKSIKVQLITGLSLILTILLLLIPKISHEVERRTINSFETKNKTEQINLLESIIYQQREGLISWVRPWIRDKNLAPLSKEKVNLKKWEQGLLGIGNQISVKFGVERILTHSENLSLMSDYHLERKLEKSLDKSNSFKSILHKTKNDDAITSGVFEENNKLRKLIVIMPVEHEQTEKVFYISYVIDLRSILKKYNQTVKYISILTYNDKIIQLDEDNDFLENIDSLRNKAYIKYNKKIISKRIINLPEYFIGTNATLQVYVDVTSLIKELHKTQDLIIMIILVTALVSLSIFFFLIHFLLRPLDLIVKTARDVSYGNYETRCNLNSKNEIGELSNSIDEMLDKITKQNDANLELTKINAHNSKLASIGELAAGVGHEINNPLAIIQGNLNILKKKFETVPGIDEKYKAYIHKCTLAVNRITNIVKGLRSFSRSDVDNLEEFDIQDCIDEILIMIDDIYTKKGINLTYECANEDYVYEVHANRGKFQQVVINLLSNAKDAVEENETQLIEIHNTISNEYFKVSIKDNGKGINPEIKDKIFESFFTTKEINKGTGIGLALVANIVKEFNGTIEVESELGGGTTFSVSFPVKTYSQKDYNQKQIKAEKEVEILSKIKLSPNSTTDKPILNNIIIVDDEKGILEILKSMFESIGVGVMAYDNASDAYDEYLHNSDNYQLIITDMQMPLMTGSQLIRKIRENDKLKQPEIMIITGGVNFNKDNDPETLIDLVHTTVSKPFSKKVLLENISQIFQINNDNKAA